MILDDWTGRDVRILLASIAISACGPDPAGVPVDLPNGSPGIGFDDLRYSRRLHRVLAPAGRSGRLDLIDPQMLQVATVTGFSESGDFSGGHDDGPTSVDEARGHLFVTDRSSRQLATVDPVALRIVGSVELSARPDYVRSVEQTSELWVTEPDASQIEIFALADGEPPTPLTTATIPLDNGPESLVIDQKRGSRRGASLARIRWRWLSPCRGDSLMRGLRSA